MADTGLPFLQAFQKTNKLLGRERGAELGGRTAGADRIKGGGTDADLEVGEDAEQVASFGMEGITKREDLLAIARGDAVAEIGYLLDGG
jgi:hypothetical protein